MYAFDVSLLPPNMTHLLQILDLIVNGPIKRHVRQWRANIIVTAFKKFKDLLDAEYLKPEALKKKPKYTILHLHTYA